MLSLATCFRLWRASRLSLFPCIVTYIATRRPHTCFTYAIPRGGVLVSKPVSTAILAFARPTMAGFTQTTLTVNLFPQQVESASSARAAAASTLVHFGETAGIVPVVGPILASTHLRPTGTSRQSQSSIQQPQLFLCGYQHNIPRSDVNMWRRTC